MLIQVIHNANNFFIFANRLIMGLIFEIMIDSIHFSWNILEESFSNHWKINLLRAKLE